MEVLINSQFIFLYEPPVQAIKEKKAELQRKPIYNTIFKHGDVGLLVIVWSII